MISPSIIDREFNKFREGSSGTAVAIVSDDNSESLRFDNPSPSIIYLATAPFGSLESEPKWKIQRIDTSSGVSIKNASNSFDQVWDDRASLTYV